jgi:hypothetical protein
MADIKSSCERICAEFEANGRPAPSGALPDASVGGFEVKTPKVGDGFREWAVSGFNLDGMTKDVPAGVNYDKHGDWMFDKSQLVVSADETSVYDANYLKK